MKKTVSWILVGVWMIFIFVLSNMNSAASGSKSQNIVKKTVDVTTTVGSNVGVVKKPSEEKIEKISTDLNPIFRKFSHAFVYLILAILVANALNVSKVKKVFIFTILICILYAASDEIHQLYIPGRSGEVRDVMIDTFGALIGYSFYKLMFILFNKKRKYAKIEI